MHESPPVLPALFAPDPCPEAWDHTRYLDVPAGPPKLEFHGGLARGP